MKHRRYVRKPLIWFSAIIIALGLAACRHNDEERMDYFAEKVSDKLEFNQQQDEVWQALIADLKELKSGMKSEKEATRNMLIDQLKADQLDESKLQTALEQHQQAVTEGFNILLPRINELHASLTPEQKDKLVTFIEKHKERHRHGHF